MRSYPALAIIQPAHCKEQENNIKKTKRSEKKLYNPSDMKNQVYLYLHNSNRNVFSPDPPCNYYFRRLVLLRWCNPSLVLCRVDSLDIRHRLVLMLCHQSGVEMGYNRKERSDVIFMSSFFAFHFFIWCHLG